MQGSGLFKCFMAGCLVVAEGKYSERIPRGEMSQMQ